MPTSMYNLARLLFDIRLESGPKLTSDARVDLCKKVVSEDMAVISVRFAIDSYIISRKSPTVTIADQLANVGKIFLKLIIH